MDIARIIVMACWEGIPLKNHYWDKKLDSTNPILREFLVCFAQFLHCITKTTPSKYETIRKFRP